MQNKEDRKLFQASQKLFGHWITFLEALAYLFSGITRSLLIIGQLFFAEFMVLMLDELFQKWDGFGSEIFLFIATNIF
jgi:preprotein translocase subunit SecY